MWGLGGCTSSKQVGSGGNLTGDEISIDASTVVNQNLMNEQNAVTPSEVYRNVPGMSR
jgi:outer membrane receptor for Fe3+-dicitrate